MRKHAADDPQRQTELAALLASGAVTQAAINHAGHCDGGARGDGCLLPPRLPPHHTHPPPHPSQLHPSPSPLPLGMTQA